MTVKELIEELEKIPNQNLEVKMEHEESYDDDGYMESYFIQNEICNVLANCEDELGKPYVLLM